MFFLPQAMPAQPVEFQRTFSGPDTRWWRLLLMPAGFFLLYLLAVIFLIIIPTFMVMGLDAGSAFFDKLGVSQDLNDPATLLVIGGMLALLMPTVWVTGVLTFRSKLGFLHSVAGKFRWGWFFLTLPVTFVAATVFVFIGVFLVEGAEAKLSSSASLLPLLALAIFLIPLQSAGEEYLFRGLLPQWFGAIFPWREAGIISLVLTTVFFALAHGDFSPMRMLHLLIFGAGTWIITYRTGGLEAAISIHVANNVMVFGMSALLGDPAAGSGSRLFLLWLFLLAGDFMLVLQVVVLDLLYRKWNRGLPERANCTNPSLRPVPDRAYLEKHYRKGKFYPEWFAHYPYPVQVQYANVYPQFGQYLQYLVQTGQVSVPYGYGTAPGVEPGVASVAGAVPSYGVAPGVAPGAGFTAGQMPASGHAPVSSYPPQSSDGNLS
ncbi:MAG: type II CAAX endopeptidase family protein [Actinomycetaceae bacterium]|nr:type II CAAX endopeptidase family protein [Actinomycetaceae bacterium]